MVFEYNNCDIEEFKNFLQHPSEEVDLSELSLIELIEAACKMRNVSDNYKKSHNCLLNNLRILEKELNMKIMPCMVNDVFWNFFISYLYAKKLKPSTISLIVSQVKIILGWGAKYKAVISPGYEYLYTPPYEPPQIALTLDEVSQIYHFDVYSIPNRRIDYLQTLEKVRDMFVLSCNLGQRHSDMVRIDKHCFDLTNNIFKIVQQKTGYMSVVNMNKYCLDLRTTLNILEKYDYKAPYPATIGNYNYYIKQLLSYIGQHFYDKVKLERKVNGNIEMEFKFKYKLVSTHTARRTFATVNIKRGYLVQNIKRATGHRCTRSFEKYVCLTDAYDY